MPPLTSSTRPRVNVVVGVTGHDPDNRVELELDSGGKGGGSIIVDMTRLVRGFVVRTHVGELTTVELDLIPANIAAKAMRADDGTMEQLAAIVDAWRAEQQRLLELEGGIEVTTFGHTELVYAETGGRELDVTVIGDTGRTYMPGDGGERALLDGDGS